MFAQIWFRTKLDSCMHLERQLPIPFRSSKETWGNPSSYHPCKSQHQENMFTLFASTKPPHPAVPTTTIPLDLRWWVPSILQVGSSEGPSVETINEPCTLGCYSHRTVTVTSWSAGGQWLRDNGLHQSGAFNPFSQVCCWLYEPSSQSALKGNRSGFIKALISAPVCRRQGSILFSTILGVWPVLHPPSPPCPPPNQLMLLLDAPEDCHFRARVLEGQHYRLL